MERRVIKINLVGAICVLILIIAAIVGIIVFAATRNGSGGSKPNNNEQEIQQIPEETEQKIIETVEIEGQPQEITMKKHENNDLRYFMNYAVDNFYVNKGKDKDFFKSLESDTVSISVERFEDGFIDKSKELITTEAQKRKEDTSYSMDTIDLNGRLCYIEKRTENEDLYINYFIENEKSYYHVNIHIGKAFINQIQPIVEKMMKSFRTI